MKIYKTNAFVLFARIALYIIMTFVSLIVIYAYLTGAFGWSGESLLILFASIFIIILLILLLKRDSNIPYKITAEGERILFESLTSKTSASVQDISEIKSGIFYRASARSGPLFITEISFSDGTVKTLYYLKNLDDLTNEFKRLNPKITIVDYGLQPMSSMGKLLKQAPKVIS